RGGRRAAGGRRDLADSPRGGRLAGAGLRARAGARAPRCARPRRAGRRSADRAPRRAGALSGHRVRAHCRSGRLSAPMGLANWLTILRILLIPVFVSLLVYRRPGAALIVFGVAALTDLLDGWAARHWKDESSLGAFLDPMADKLLLTSSFVTLT